MTPELPRLLEYAIDLAREAGKLTARHFGTGMAVELKDDQSPVTAADRETEQYCRRRLGLDWPEHGIIGEEFGASPARGRYTWVVDPIDGTKSFIAGVPLYTVLISLLEDGEPVLGVIHQPILSETVWAAAGQGCWYNGRPARVRDCASLEDAWLMCTDPTHLLACHPRAGRELLEAVRYSRTWGDGYGYLLVASGRADLMVDPRMNLWDVACMVPIISEAGGVLSDLTGRPGAGTSCMAGARVPHAQALALFTAP